MILATDERVSEEIKWQAPTFVYKGNIASFFPKAMKHVTLMFHQGASLGDPSGLLEGEGETSRSAKFTSVAAWPPNGPRSRRSSPRGSPARSGDEPVETPHGTAAAQHAGRLDTTRDHR